MSSQQPQAVCHLGIRRQRSTSPSSPTHSHPVPHSSHSMSPSHFFPSRSSQHPPSAANPKSASARRARPVLLTAAHSGCQDLREHPGAAERPPLFHLALRVLPTAAGGLPLGNAMPAPDVRAVALTLPPRPALVTFQAAIALLPLSGFTATPEHRQASERQDTESLPSGAHGTTQWVSGSAGRCESQENSPPSTPEKQKVDEQ